jgi:hypothetical protein
MVQNRVCGSWHVPRFAFVPPSNLLNICRHYAECYGSCSILVVVNTAFEGTERHIRVVTLGVNLSGANTIKPKATEFQ